VPLPRAPKRIPPLFLVFPVILAAALALGRYAYLQSKALGVQSEQAIRDSNEAVAEQVVSVIEKEIIASDHTLFELIDLSNLKRFTDRWNENVRLSPNVDAVVVLDDKQHILALASRGGREGAFGACSSGASCPRSACRPWRPTSTSTCTPISTASRC